MVGTRDLLGLARWLGVAATVSRLPLLPGRHRDRIVVAHAIIIIRFHVLARERPKGEILGAGHGVITAGRNTGRQASTASALLVPTRIRGNFFFPLLLSSDFPILLSPCLFSC